LGFNLSPEGHICVLSRIVIAPLRPATKIQEGFMRKMLVAFGLLLLTAPASAQNVSTGISIADGVLKSFYLAIGDYYRVPESRVAYTRKHYRVPDEELPVFFFLAARAHVDPDVIIDLRIGQRMSWLNVTLHYGLTPEIYYVPVQRVGPPYGKAYGYYKKHGQDYRKVVLADSDVINLVNLRFISEYHGVAAEMVMDMRGQGQKFVVINEEVGKGKGRHGDDDDDKGKDKQKGQGKGKGKGKD
jgi:hypothetical protein